jgi:S-adenosylmethionine synthetase
MPGPERFSNAVHVLRLPPAETGAVEIVERKGAGHPDTICDALACQLSIAYARYTRAHCDGLILHHQFDKVMLVGGRTEVDFGQVGRFIEPIRVIVAGRASTEFKGIAVPVASMVEETVRSYMTRHFPIPDPDRSLVVEQRWSSAPGPGTLRGSTGPIAQMFQPSTAAHVRGYGSHQVANDTSYTTAHAPFSRLEQAVLSLEKWLNSDAVKATRPWLGSDIKIMAVRVHDAVELTACVPQIARHVPSLEHYMRHLDEIRESITAKLAQSIPIARIHLNTKDDPRELNLYLTVTGASLSGDIGVTGRGNRPCGLITSHRGMSLEGACGKNPRYYSGIVYNFAARRIADTLYSRTSCRSSVNIVSQNGAPLLAPWHVIVETECADEALVRSIVQEGLSHIPRYTEEFLDGGFVLY